MVSSPTYVLCMDTSPILHAALAPYMTFPLKKQLPSVYLRKQVHILLCHSHNLGTFPLGHHPVYFRKQMYILFGHPCQRDLSGQYSIYHHHHHHHVVPPAWISQTLSRHFSLSFITSGRSLGLHPVSSHSGWMYVWAGRPAFDWPYVEVLRSTSLMSSSLLLQKCPIYTYYFMKGFHLWIMFTLVILYLIT